MDATQLKLPPVIPVTVIDDPEDAAPLAAALSQGGLPVIEVTFRTDAALESIRRIRAAEPDMIAGAGTILNAQQAQAAIDAGVRFAVAPGTNPEVLAKFQEAGVPFMPGVATPSEIERAIGLGCRRLKFFPVHTIGGAPALKAMTGPYAHLGIEYCPTGGVTLETLPDYSALPQVVAVGGSWIATRDDIRGHKWDAIAKKAAAAVEVATSAAGC